RAVAVRLRRRSRDLPPPRDPADRPLFGRDPACREHPVRSLPRDRLRRSAATDRGRHRGRGVRLSRGATGPGASPPSSELSLQPRARGARLVDPMSKFVEALAQAERERALRQSSEASSLPAPAAVTEREPAPEPPPVAALSDGSAAFDEHLVSLLKPRSFEAEQYRALRHLVEHLHRTAELSVVAVSSPVANDGKTTTAINLAGALAQDPEARVLLVDADLRRGALAKHLGLGES